MFILDVSQIKENFLKNSISTETHNQIYFGCTKQQIKNQTKKKNCTDVYQVYNEFKVYM